MQKEKRKKIKPKSKEQLIELTPEQKQAYIDLGIYLTNVIESIGGEGVFIMECFDGIVSHVPPLPKDFKRKELPDYVG